MKIRTKRLFNMFCSVMSNRINTDRFWASSYELRVKNTHSRGLRRPRFIERTGPRAKATARRIDFENPGRVAGCRGGKERRTLSPEGGTAPMGVLAGASRNSTRNYCWQASFRADPQRIMDSGIRADFSHSSVCPHPTGYA